MNAVVLIPARNEEPTLGRVLGLLADQRLGLPTVVIDDGSADRTAELARAAGVRVVSHRINLGYSRALLTGLRFALRSGFEYALTLDGDGQHDPKYLAVLIERALQPDRPDLVLGSRFLRQGDYETSLPRKVGMRGFSLLTRLMAGRRIYDTTSGFRCWARRAMQLAVGAPVGDLHSELIVYGILSGLSVVEVPIQVGPRVHGRSMYDALSSTLYPFKTLLVAVILSRLASRRREVVGGSIER